MKTFFTIIFISLITFSSTDAFARGGKRDTSGEKAAAQHYINNEIITPETFRKVERFISKNYPEIDMSEGSWLATKGGFSKQYSVWSGSSIDITWTGEIWICRGRISGGNMKIGEWTNL